jgi:hypothetical protein
MRPLILALFTSLIPSTASAASRISGSDQIAFVYEVVRHGARAPLANEPEGYFKVPTEELTAQGMRQRYLLGRRDR